MLQYFKDLSIRIKISGFIIPSTIAFGMVMTLLSLFFLNDYKNTSIEEFTQVIEQIEQEERRSLTEHDIEQMDTMANSVTDSVIEVDDTVVSVREASETLKGLAEDSAKMTQQFRTS